MSLKTRAKRFRKLAKAFGALQPDPLVAAAPIGGDDYAALQAAALAFVEACSGAKGWEACAQALEAGKAENLTPNGKLMPKARFQEPYNHFVASVSMILAKLGVDPHLETFRMPTIRFKAAQDLASRDRPYSTEKLHTECWLGYENSDVGAFHIPLAGDVAGNRVNFWKTPKGFEESWMLPLKDFEEAAEILKTYDSLEVIPKIGNIYLFEGATVHSSHRDPGCGGRFSLENFFVFREKVDREMKLPPFEPRPVDQGFSFADYYSIGRGRTFVVKDSMSGVVEGTLQDEAASA